MTAENDRSEMPLWLDGRAPCEAFTLRVREPAEQERLRARIFNAIIEEFPTLSIYVHFDEDTGLLMMPERPGGASDELERDLSLWEQTRAGVAHVASAITGQRVESLIRGELTYRFRFHQFEDTHWQHLQHVYARLPGWLGGGHDLPRWYGLSEAFPPFLWASVEPFGLECFGILRREEWDAWHQAFISEIRDLPALRRSMLELVEH